MVGAGDKAIASIEPNRDLMKIAIPATAPNLDAQVEHKLGTAAYLLVIDMDDMSFEAMEGPPP